MVMVRFHSDVWFRRENNDLYHVSRSTDSTVYMMIYRLIYRWYCEVVICKILLYIYIYN